jgi:hypothetical protein
VEFLGQGGKDAVFGDADGFGGVTQGVFDGGLFLALAEDDADGGGLAVFADGVVEEREVELHLADVFGLEFADLEFDGDEAAEPPVEE